MLDVCLLGTAGMMPLPHRWLTAALMRYNGSNLLIDCGEGTQIAIKEKGWTFKPIDVICFTHYHADHISGLPGLLLTMGNAERTEPLTMIGPKGLEKVVSALRMIAPELPFEIRYIELTGPEEDMEINGYHIHAFKVNHNISCYGYTVEIRRAGRFDVERARNNHIPQKLWNPLQKGQTVTTEDGITFTPDMVLGAPRKGIKVTYCTDTRPTEDIVKCARHSDLFICEGMYAEKDKIANGLKSKTIKEANEFANSMGFKADYTGVDIQCANEWNLGLYNAKKDFPEIANQINFVGSSQKRHSLLKKDIKEYYLNKYKDAQGDEKEKKKEAESFANLLTKGLKVGKYEMASSYSPKNINEDSDEIDKIFYKYRGITLNKKYFNNYGEVIKKGLYQVKNKWHPEACHTVKATFDHEFAHQIDAYLNIRDNEIIKKLYDDRNKQEITDGLSTYSWKNNNKNKYSEMIAEGWSEYCNNQKPRGMAKTIGKEIEKTWKTRKKS